MQLVEKFREPPAGASRAEPSCASVAMVGLSSAWLLLLALSQPVVAAPGDLDVSFGDGGFVSTAFSVDDFASAAASAVVPQPDGKILVAGAAQSGPSQRNTFAIARYNPDGTLDPSFGSGGLVTTDFGGVRGAAVSAMVRQADGRILAAGTSALALTTQFALARYNPDGSLDPSFGSGGQVTTDFAGVLGSHASDLVLQADGRLVVAGGATHDFALARYNPDGTLDPSFGSGGRVITALGNNTNDAAQRVALQPDGRILVLGVSTPPAVPSGGLPSLDSFFPVLVRYNVDGSLDTTFGNGGQVNLGLSLGNFFSADFALPADGMIVVLWEPGFVAAGVSNPSTLARYHPNGTLDPSFGAGGTVSVNFGGAGGSAARLALQPDGKVVVAGSAGDFALARYHPDGSLDSTFGVGGNVTGDIPGSIRSRASALSVQSDGKIIVVGLDNAGGPSTKFAVARYEGGPTGSAPIVAVHLNRVTLVAGQPLQVDITVANLGPAIDADVYAGAMLPDGETLVFATRLSPFATAVGSLTADTRTFQPLLTNVHIAEGFTGEIVSDFQYTFAGVEPPGQYVVFAALVERGAFLDGRMDPGDILVLAGKAFTYSELTAPTLIAPIHNAVFKQNDPSTGCPLHVTRGFGWHLRFDWTGSRSQLGIVRYEMQVTHEDRTFSFGNPPFGQFFVNGSEFVDRRCAAFVADDLLEGWEWRVRAIDSLGNAGPWSETGTFRFEACRLVDGGLCR